MNYKKVLFILLLLFLPFNVHANIICNDGTMSATCADCHQGCCSRHGGCTADAQNNDNNYNYSSYSYQDNSNADSISEQSTPSVQSDDSSNSQGYQTQTDEIMEEDDSTTVQETIPPEEQYVDEENSENNDISNESNLSQNNNSSEEEISDDAVEGFLGLWGTSAIGAATYTVIKNKRRK